MFPDYWKMIGKPPSRPTPPYWFTWTSTRNKKIVQFKSVVESTKIRKQYLSSTFFKTIGYTCIMLRVLYQVSNLIVHCCTNLNQNDLNIQLHTIPGWSIRGPRQHQNNYFIKCLCLHLEKQERWSNKWPVVLPVPPRDPAPPHKSPFVLRRHQNLLFAPASCRAPRPEGWWRWAVKGRQSGIVQFTANLSLLVTVFWHRSPGSVCCPHQKRRGKLICSVHTKWSNRLRLWKQRTAKKRAHAWLAEYSREW